MSAKVGAKDEAFAANIEGRILAALRKVKDQEGAFQGPPDTAALERRVRNDTDVHRMVVEAFGGDSYLGNLVNGALVSDEQVSTVQTLFELLRAAYDVNEAQAKRMAVLIKTLLTLYQDIYVKRSACPKLPTLFDATQKVAAVEELIAQIASGDIGALEKRGMDVERLFLNLCDQMRAKGAPLSGPDVPLQSMSSLAAAMSDVEKRVGGRYKKQIDAQEETINALKAANVKLEEKLAEARARKKHKGAFT